MKKVMFQVSWGANSHGQLNTGDCEDLCSPIKSEIHIDGVYDGAAGGGHTVLLTRNGGALACGWNGKGQLGLADQTVTSTPTLLPILFPSNKSISKVACGWDFTGFLSDQGDVYMCGSNKFGQLGLGEDVTMCYKPTILGLTATSLACGLRHTIAVTPELSVVGFGSSKYGQISGYTKTFYQPTEISLMHHDEIYKLEVHCGAFFSLVLVNGVDVYVWGRNEHGQAGCHPDLHRAVLLPMKVEIGVANREVKVVSCGQSHVMVVTGDNRVFTWGRSDYCQLGRGTGGGMELLTLLTGYGHNVIISQEQETQ